MGIGTDITNSTVGNITGKTFVDESNRTSLTSLLGRVGYSYADRYYTEFSFRYERLPMGFLPFCFIRLAFERGELYAGLQGTCG